MFIEQPYESLTLKHFDQSRLTYLVNRYIIESYGYMLENKKIKRKEFKNGTKVLQQVTLLGMSDTENEIEDMTFPLINEEKGWICFDMRKYVKSDKRTGHFEYKRGGDIDFVNMRNELTALWYVGFTKEMYFFSLPHLAYAKWISSLIASKFMLNPKEELDINTLALIFYSRLFTDERHEDDIDKLSVRFRDTLYTKGMLQDIYSRSLQMKTLEDFCGLLYEVTGNIRLKDFNVQMLYRLTQTSWMGIETKNNLAIAIEYPPIWIAMCYSSLVNNMFKKTNIGDKVESLSKRGEGQAFIRSVDEFIKSHIEE